MDFVIEAMIAELAFYGLGGLAVRQRSAVHEIVTPLSTG
jgi:hypothetical protein